MKWYQINLSQNEPNCFVFIIAENDFLIPAILEPQLLKKQEQSKLANLAYCTTSEVLEFIAVSGLRVTSSKSETSRNPHSRQMWNNLPPTQHLTQ